MMEKLVRQRVPLAAAALAICTTALFWPVLFADFINYDDNMFVTQNKLAQAGITWQGLGYYGSHVAAGFYAPLMWYSHMLGCELFGLWAGGHHLINLLLHTASALLLLLFFVKTTGAFWRSLLVAFLFAVHPLHVESVAWVAERKDVLSGLFFVLTLVAYAVYAKKPSWSRYAGVLCAFILGLLSKSMLVTLPCLLLLLDYWPLGRMPAPLKAGPEWPAAANDVPCCPWWLLVAEKLPFLSLSLLFSYLTVQQLPIIDFERMPLDLRLINTMIGYGKYTWLSFFPSGLAVFYPLDLKDLTLGAALAWGLPIAAITVASVAMCRKQPAVTVGWLWFVGLLVPVIGIVQQGAQAMADHFTYLPSIGLFTALAWALYGLLPKQFQFRKIAVVVTVLWLAGLSAATVLQVRTWHDTLSVFQHAMAVTDENARAARYVGQCLVEQGKAAEAIPYYERALTYVPSFRVARLEMARACASIGQWSKAAQALMWGIRHAPWDKEMEGDFIKACWNLPDAVGRERLLGQAFALNPQSHDLRVEWGRSLAAAGKTTEAVSVFDAAVIEKPEDERARCYLGYALLQAGRESEAEAVFRKALSVFPGQAQVLAGLAQVLYQAKDKRVRNTEEALRLATQADESTGGSDPFIHKVLEACQAERAQKDAAGRSGKSR